MRVQPRNGSGKAKYEKYREAWCLFLCPPKPVDGMTSPSAAVAPISPPAAPSAREVDVYMLTS